MSSPVRNGRIRMFNLAERLTHGAAALSFVVLLLSSASMMWSWARWLMPVFGGPRWVALVHVWAGYLFTLALVVALLGGFRSWVLRVLRWGPNDLAFVRHFLAVYFSRHSYADAPPQERFNGGMKAWSLVAIAGGLGVAVTGLLLAFKGSVGHAGFQVVLGLHVLFALLLTAGVIGHVYLAAFHPEARQSFGSMFGDGTVSLEYASTHHAAWLEEVGVKPQRAGRAGVPERAH
ncbi:MAG: cytochrome b/b6 domain-containing protein [Bacillota bacterium]|nr:cytochrome b/b6 domain-containing protein [Bacillota bacterium]